VPPITHHDLRPEEEAGAGGDWARGRDDIATYSPAPFY
jgi:hypothetical protein